MQMTALGPTLAAIAVGAVLGAWSRYGLSVALNGRGWLPWGTFAANAIGGLLIGLAIAHFSARTDISPLWRMFFVTGFLGALTTFSSFSAEVVEMLMRQRYLPAAGTVLLHLGGSLLLTVAGIRTASFLIAVRA